MSWDDQRPMSPHLQIYKLPITAKLSVLHRGTGVVIFIGLILMVWGLASIASGKEGWETVHNVLSSGVGQVILFGFIFSLYYHLVNGIRHLLWDIGWGLSLKVVHQSGFLVLGVAIGFTVLTGIIVL
ncbi:MAG: succinate dehydrogenase, cytochrome b556 subunit [Cocleimonas sp.]|nr:succinate dehydrogenase, cytochrome b556 subunit [Cocleimonas sp.]